MYDIDTLFGIKNLIKKEIDAIKENIVYNIDTPERLAAIKSGNAAPAMTKTQQGLQAIRGAVEGAGPLTTIGTQSAIEGVERLKEIEQDELDRYNRELQDRGIRGKAERRTAIRNIYLGIGYDEDYVDSMLDRFGYKGGGITMTDEQFATLLSSLRDDEDKY